jgi:hypothetical protein
VWCRGTRDEFGSGGRYNLGRQANRRPGGHVAILAPVGDVETVTGSERVSVCGALDATGTLSAVTCNLESEMMQCTIKRISFV